jgi:hypothetical protein
VDSEITSGRELVITVLLTGPSAIASGCEPFLTNIVRAGRSTTSFGLWLDVMKLVRVHDLSGIIRRVVTRALGPSAIAAGITAGPGVTRVVRSILPP